MMLTRNHTGRSRPAPKISTQITLRRVILTTQHRSSQNHRPIISLPSRPNGNRTGKLRVWVYPRVGLGRSINNRTDINARCVRSNSLGKLGAERANGRDAQKKTSWVHSFPFPSFPCLRPPPFPSTFLYVLPASAKESAGALKLVSESGRHLVNFGLKECF